MAESVASRLYLFWTTVAPGIGVSMSDMLAGLGIKDPQVIRSALTALRKGRVHDPADETSYLPRLLVWYVRSSGLYYDYARMTGSPVEAQVPGVTLANRFGDLFTRVANLNSTLGKEGVLEARAQSLLDDAELREFISQIPILEIERIRDTINEIAHVKRILLTEAIRRPKVE